MEIEKLIEELREIGECMNDYGGELMFKAAEVIKLLWEVAKDTTNAKYKLLFDEQRWNNGKE